jgi:hypothetical protein
VSVRKGVRQSRPRARDTITGAGGRPSPLFKTQLCELSSKLTTRVVRGKTLLRLPFMIANKLGVLCHLTCGAPPRHARRWNDYVCNRDGMPFTRPPY